jgi:peptidoglycan/xylan/chitin deacetylase (PgdA/CDA1 family)
MYAGSGTYSLPNFNFHVTLGLARQRERMMARGVAELKGLDAARADECLAAMKAALGPTELARHIAKVPSKRFMSWDQVRHLQNRGAEIGSHASVHWSMHANQSEAYLREQAEGSKAQIEAEVGTCNYFAYPFGRRTDCSTKAWQAVRDAGYSHAFTAIPGTLEASRNSWLLPRYGIGIHETATETMVPMLRANNWQFRRWQGVAES